QLEIQSLQDQLSTLRNEVILYITENRATKVASTSEPSIKVRHPDTFSGKPSACSNFFSQLALVFAASPDKFNTDSSKVLYAISYLSGTPFSYMEPYLMKANLPESDRPAILSNYNLFKETITRAFGDPNPIENADRAIRQLRQTTSVAAYATEFRRLQMLIDWNQPPLISQFLSGLKYNVSQELNRREPIEDIDTLISTAIQIDNRLFSHPQRRQPPVNPTATMPPKPTAYNPFASPVSAPSTTPPANSDGPQPMDLSTASSTRRPPLTPAQRAYRIENNLCLYCGGKRHRPVDSKGHLLGNLASPHATVTTPVSDTQSPDKPNTLTIPVIILSKHYHIKTYAMVDSGASSSFIDATFALKNNLPSLSRKMTITLADGSKLRSNSASQVTLKINDNHLESIYLQQLDLGSSPIILGLSWLQQHNPDINWTENIVHLPCTLTSCGPNHVNLDISLVGSNQFKEHLKAPDTVYAGAITVNNLESLVAPESCENLCLVSESNPKTPVTPVIPENTPVEPLSSALMNNIKSLQPKDTYFGPIYTDLSKKPDSHE
ncbi:Retrotransposon-derived protein PEG10, partial [Zancudomyces culisetae]